MKKAESIMMAAEAFAENYGKEPLFQPRHGKEMPKRAAVITDHDSRTMINKEILTNLCPRINIDSGTPMYILRHDSWNQRNFFLI